METYFNKEDAGLITCTPRTCRSSTSRAVPPQKFVTMAVGLSRFADHPANEIKGEQPEHAGG
jgi:hypothetical protein